jgi:hypothetical protein
MAQKNALSPEDVVSVLEISQTLYRGFRHTDEKNWNERVTYFTDELTIDFGGVKPSQTIKASALMDWARVAYALVDTQHMSFNLDVQLDGDRAISFSYGHARHQRTDTRDFWHIYARYEHEYVRTDGGWKIARIKMTPVFEEGNPKLLEESFAAASNA